jgi:2-isopropylmalate synthase
MKSDKRIYILDTTLRDGQQSPGAGMSFVDNLQYAQYADLLKVDVLEAGFPAASQIDFEIVNEISQNMADKKSEMIIAALCQLREEQFVRTMESLMPSVYQRKARIHTYVPVDPNLMYASLGSLAKDKNRIIKELYRLITIATKEGFEVEFSPEGYSRMGTNFNFVTDLIRAAVSAGAKVINCPDTIGGSASIEGEEYFVTNMQTHADIIAHEFPNKEIIWSTHCHNDFGLALANTINAVFDGPARQIEGCINGVGERAGNVALEQCIMYIKQFGSRADTINPYYTNINTNYIKKISDFVAEKMLPCQPHYPIVGSNSTKHSSGGHTNAILKNPLAYQPFDPREIGSKVDFVFGPLSGSNHAKRVIEKHGYRCDHDEKTTIAQAIKNYYADRRKGITDEELIKGYLHFRSPIKLEEISHSKTNKHGTGLLLFGKFFDQENIEIHYNGANFALDALSKAVEEFLPGIRILNSESHSNITVKMGENEHYIDEKIDIDNGISTLKAFIDAVNKTYVDIHYRIEG